MKTEVYCEGCKFFKINKLELKCFIVFFTLFILIIICMFLLIVLKSIIKTPVKKIIEEEIIGHEELNKNNDCKYYEAKE